VATRPSWGTGQGSELFIIVLIVMTSIQQYPCASNPAKIGGEQSMLV
jgi:hypothetical protein